MATKLKNPYTVKAVKSGTFEEGNFTCNIYLGSKRVASVICDGIGRGLRYYAKDKVLRADFDRFAEEYTGESFEPSDALVYEMVTAYELRKRILAKRKTHTFYEARIEPEYEGASDTTTYTINAPYSPRVEQIIRQRTPTLIKVYDPSKL